MSNGTLDRARTDSDIEPRPGFHAFSPVVHLYLSKVILCWTDVAFGIALETSWVKPSPQW
jgi:hypothetical protein